MYGNYCFQVSAYVIYFKNHVYIFKMSYIEKSVTGLTFQHYVICCDGNLKASVISAQRETHKRIFLVCFIKTVRTTDTRIEKRPAMPPQGKNEDAYQTLMIGGGRGGG